MILYFYKNKTFETIPYKKNDTIASATVKAGIIPLRKLLCILMKPENFSEFMIDK
jgi:hypothetical protein